MSSRIGSNTKQKRPYRIVYAPIPLPEHFPLRVHSFFAQDDAPITYLHGHDCLELGYCYEGAGVFVIGEKVLPFQAGDVSFITPSEFHLARSMAGTQSKWAWIYLDPVRLLQASHPEFDFLRVGHLAGKSFRNIVSPQVDPLAGVLVRQIVDELRENRRGCRPRPSSGGIWQRYPLQLQVHLHRNRIQGSQRLRAYRRAHLHLQGHARSAANGR